MKDMIWVAWSVSLNIENVQHENNDEPKECYVNVKCRFDWIKTYIGWQL